MLVAHGPVRTGVVGVRRKRSVPIRRTKPTSEKNSLRISIRCSEKRACPQRFRRHSSWKSSPAWRAVNGQNGSLENHCPRVGLASLLKPFGILPGTIRTDGIASDGVTAKGYKRSAFEKAWKNYGIGDNPSPSVTTSQPLSDNGYSDSPSVTNLDPVTDTKSRKPAAANGCDVVTDTQASIPPLAKAFEQSERGAKARRRAATRHSDEPQSDTDDGIVSDCPACGRRKGGDILPSKALFGAGICTLRGVLVAA